MAEVNMVWDQTVFDFFAKEINNLFCVSEMHEKTQSNYWVRISVYELLKYRKQTTNWTVLILLGLTFELTFPHIWRS